MEQTQIVGPVLPTERRAQSTLAADPLHCGISVPSMSAALIGRSRSSAFRLSAGNSNSSTTSTTLEQASEQIVGSKNTNLALLLLLETEYLAIGEQGGCTTRVDKHNMVVAPATPRTSAISPAKPLGPLLVKMDFRMIEPPDASERNKPANFLPSIGAVCSRLCSNLHLTAEFDYSVRRNAEKFRRRQRVAMHGLEQFAADRA